MFLVKSSGFRMFGCGRRSATGMIGAFSFLGMSMSISNPEASKVDNYERTKTNSSKNKQLLVSAFPRDCLIHVQIIITIRPILISKICI